MPGETHYTLVWCGMVLEKFVYHSAPSAATSSSMNHHEFVVDTSAVWVRGPITESEASATICPSPVN